MFLAICKFTQSRNDINLKRRAVADKVLALKLQKELFDYIDSDQNVPAEIQTERVRLKNYIKNKMNKLNL